jgi:hypothetical protein
VGRERGEEKGEGGDQGLLEEPWLTRGDWEAGELK